MSLPLALTIAKDLAPSLVRLLTNSKSAETATERIVAVASELTGQESPEDIISTLREDKAMSAQLTLRLSEIEMELDRLYMEDRQDARKRDVALAAAGGRNVRADVMILTVTLGLLACLYVLTSFREDLPGEVVGIVSTIAGIFGACLRDAFQFEFGSSRGSKDKDVLLARRD